MPRLGGQWDPTSHHQGSPRLNLSCCTHPTVPCPPGGRGAPDPPGLNSSGLSHSSSSWCTDQRLMTTLAPLGMEYSPMLQADAE